MGIIQQQQKNCAPSAAAQRPVCWRTKIEGQPICKECDSQIDLPDGAVNRMSLSDFQAVLAAFADNKRLQSEFSKQLSISYRLFERHAVCG